MSVLTPHEPKLIGNDTLYMICDAVASVNRHCSFVEPFYTS